MTTKTKPASELDEFFEGDGPTSPHDDSSDATYDYGKELAAFNAEIKQALDELLPNASSQKRKAVLKAACSTDQLPVLFEKEEASFWIGKLNSFIANVEKKAAETGKATSKKIKDMQDAGNEQSLIDDRDRYIRDLKQDKKADAPLTKSASPASEPQDKPDEMTAVDNTPLPEAKFVAWFDAFDEMGLKVSFTVRATRVSEGLKELASLKQYVFANGYSASRAQVDPPSTANRRIGAEQTANAPKQSGASAPVRSFDPDADNKPKSGEVLHEKVIEIEKVMAQDGKLQINLYAPDKPKYPVFYFKSDADKEEVWKHIDVDAMQLATRYTFKATVDYVLSTKLNSRGNPYKNLRAIHPE